jgi:hypothetical protein
MFFGAVLNEEKGAFSFESIEFTGLNITRAVLASGESAQLFVRTEAGQDFLVCSLSKSKVDQVNLDLIISTECKIKLLVKGPGTIHVSGSYDSADMDG